MNFNYKKRLREREEWITDSSRKRSFVEPALLIEKKIAERDEHWIAIVGSKMGMISNWYAQIGVQAIGKNELNLGWGYLNQAASYEIWYNRIIIQLVELDSRPNKPQRLTPRSLTLSFFAALWTGNWEMVERLGEKYVRWMKDENLFGKSIYIQNGIAGFALTLYEVWKNKSAVNTPQHLPLGPYEAIFKNWTDQEILKQAVFDTCDFHVERTQEHDDYDIAEFLPSPYDILPVEYLALKQVRKFQGLNTPRPKHPLLETTFAEPPEMLPVFEDKLLDQVTTAVRDFIPN